MKFSGSTREAFIRSCTVKIREHKKKGWGTGFFVAPDLVVTCAHVCGQRAQPGKAYELFSPHDLEHPRFIATVETILPTLWPEDNCYPDIAFLRTHHRSIDHPYVRLGAGFRPGDVVWGHGFSRDRPAGEDVSGRISGSAKFGPEDQALNADFELIKFVGDQISSGLSGSPLVNQRTGRVCGMVKKTRDAITDRGGHAVQVEAILKHLDAYLPDWPIRQRNPVTRWLQSIFGNRRTAVWGSTVYTSLAMLLGVIGLLLSYGPFSSPAWEADFGYAFSNPEWREAFERVQARGMVDAKGNLESKADILSDLSPWKGCFIEGVRLFLIAGLFVFLTAFVFNNTYVQIEEIPAPFTTGWWRSFGTGLLLATLLFVFIGLVIYHVRTGPQVLSLHGKFWSQLKSVTQLWTDTPSLQTGFWKRLNEAASTEELSNLQSAFYREQRGILYERPYACYFLYSFSTFVLLGVPALMISGRALYHSTKRVLRGLQEIESLLDTKTISDRVRSLSARLGGSIIDNFDWYASCLLSTGVMSAFEYWLGQQALAPIAYAFTTSSLLLFWLALAFPTFALCRHLMLTKAASFATAEKQLKSAADLIWTRKGMFCAIKVTLSTILVWLSVAACLHAFHLL